jgi:peptide/nickel transport system permease protein
VHLGLDRSAVSQYLHWLGGLVVLDFGTSLVGNVPVSSLLGPALVNSLCLLLVVVLIALPLSVVLGALTAIRRDRAVDRSTLVVSLLLTALPEFVTGMLLVLLLATTVFHVLPAVAAIPPGELPLRYPAEMALPVLTLVLVVMPYLYRLVRASMIDVLESEYVTMARLKGMPERIVLRRHALPNALIPVIQGTALTLAYLLGGLVVIEFLFSYPGIGILLTQAVSNRDVPVIQGVAVVLAAGVVIFNLVADVLTVYVTPKLRTGDGRR